VDYDQVKTSQLKGYSTRNNSSTWQIWDHSWISKHRRYFKSTLPIFTKKQNHN